MLMLGSYYWLSLHSARNAIVDFNKRSSVTMAKLELDDDVVMPYLRRLDVKQPHALVTSLAQHFSGYAFILVDNTGVVASSLHAPVTLSGEQLESGYRFVLQQPGHPASVINVPAAPEPVVLEKEAAAGLYWLPLAWLDVGKQQDQLSQWLNNRFMQLFLVLSLLAVLLSWLGARWLVQPVQQLLQGFAALRSGRLGWRIQSARADEMGQLFAGFNHLAADLQRLDQQYRQMSADLAHELRTPLTAVIGRLEAMQDGVVPADAEQLAQLQTDVARISNIIEDLNLLSLTQAGQLNLTLVAVDVSSLLAQLQRSYQAQADKMDLVLQMHCAADLVVQADSGRLLQVLSNLLNNAFRYGASGGSILLHASAQEGVVQISVQDKGPGLPPELRAQLFQRYNHSRTQGGAGLGLAICYQLCQLMQAEIKATSPDTGGLCVSLSFAALKRV